MLLQSKAQLPEPPESPLEYDVSVQSDIAIEMDVIPEVFAKGVSTGVWWAVNDSSFGGLPSFSNYDEMAESIWASNVAWEGQVAFSNENYAFQLRGATNVLSGVITNVVGLNMVVADWAENYVDLDAYLQLEGWDWQVMLPFHLLGGGGSNGVFQAVTLDCSALERPMQYIGNAIFWLWRLSVLVMGLRVVGLIGGDG